MPTTHQYLEPPHLAFPKMPGRYGVKCGYVYALICDRRTVKIGSAVHPRFRIGEQLSNGYIWDSAHSPGSRAVLVREIILSGAHRQCREMERALHVILQPFRIGHHRNEKYRLTDKALNSVIRLFRSPLSMRRIQEFTGVIYPQQLQSANGNGGTR